MSQRPDLEFDATPEELVSVEGGARELGRYELRYEIASGGMATVYLARARGPGGFERPIAIKRIHPHLAKRREFVEMFLDEARVTARIAHPNVCSVFDFGEASGTWFIAMEYLVGQSLATVLARLATRPDLATTPRWLALAARIVADACEGLHAAHELKDESGKAMGVVHRDASPHNVLVTYDGAVKVVDFGVALAEGRTHQTQNRTLKGKLAYMPPEQVRGEKLDRRADVWSMGVCLWELLTVRRLFALSSDAAIVEAVARAPIDAPSTHFRGIPGKLDAIVLRALSRDVDQRYPTARALGRDLGAFAASVGVGTGLADLSELMEELFAAERKEKLGVVARVLGSASESMESGEHVARRVETSVARPSGRGRPGLLGRLDPEDDGEKERTLVHSSARSARISSSGRVAQPSAPPPPPPPPRRPAAAAPPPALTPGLEVTKIALLPEAEPPESPHFIVAPPLAPPPLAPPPLAPPSLAPPSLAPPAPSRLAPPPAFGEEPPMAPALGPGAAWSGTKPWMWAAGVAGCALLLAIAVGASGGESPSVRAVQLSTPTTTLPSRTITSTASAPVVAPPVFAPPVFAPPVVAPPVVAAPPVFAPPVVVTPPVIAPPIDRRPIEPRPTAPVAPSRRVEASRRADPPRTPPTAGDRAPRPSSSATGTVNVAARGGWADIFVDGAPRGRTPTRLVLPVGRHALELRPGDGSAVQRMNVVVEADAVERVVVTLGE